MLSIHLVNILKNYLISPNHKQKINFKFHNLNYFEYLAFIIIPNLKRNDLQHETL